VAIKAGKTTLEIWPDSPAAAAKKDMLARRTQRIDGKFRHRPDGTPLPCRRSATDRAPASTAASASSARAL
jgi:hypothetical protein